MPPRAGRLAAAAARAGAALLVAVAATCAAAAPVGVHTPAADQISWRGLVDAGADDQAAAQMLYPAPNLAGLLVAIVTHNVLVQSTRGAEERRRQAVADEVLQPYRGTIDALTPEALVRAAVERSGGELALPGADKLPDSPGTLRFAPGFSLRRDEAMLALDCAVRLVRDDGQPVALMVRVFGLAPLPEPAPAASPASAPASAVAAASAPAALPVIAGPAARPLWLADDGRRFRAEAADMLAHALQLAARAASLPGGDAVPFRTQRFHLGDRERMERAQLVAETCGRRVLRNLRGDLLSVPRTDVPADCTEPYRLPR